VQILVHEIGERCAIDVVDAAWHTRRDPQLHGARRPIVTSAARDER
jgi:hypothetical protein